MVRCVLGDIIDVFTHEQRSVDIRRIERGGRRSEVGQGCIARCARPGVTSHIGIIGIELVVGGDDGHTLPARNIVHRVAGPCVLIILHMHNEQAMTRQAPVEAHRLTVLQHIILIAVFLIIQDVSLRIRSQRFHAVDTSHRFDFRRCQPAGKHTLIGRESGWCMGIIIVTARAHHIPVAHTEVRTIRTGVVHIGQAQTMAELMTGSTNAVQDTGIIDAITHQLRRTTIGVNRLSIVFTGISTSI